MIFLSKHKGLQSIYIIVVCEEWLQTEINIAQCNSGLPYKLGQPILIPLLNLCCQFEVRVWQIPEGGLKENMEEAKYILNGHIRRCSAIEWHPTAKNIIASAGFDRQVRIVRALIRCVVSRQVDSESRAIYCCDCPTFSDYLCIAAQALTDRWGLVGL